MRICFLGAFTAGGTERASFMVANLLATDNEVFLLNTKQESPTFFLRDLKMDYLHSGNILKRNWTLLKYLVDNRIDLLITVEAMTGILSIIPSKLARCKHIIWEHANYYQNQGTRFIKAVRQIELLLADGYVVLTKRDYCNFTKNFIVKTRLAQIYNIADVNSECEYNADSKTIISVGHIRKIKNFGIIPDVGRMVFSIHPDWCWKIFGLATGEEYDRIHKKVLEYGLENNIIFAGRSDNISKEYESASMCVMTSLMEGLPMVLLEAKTHRLPLISFNIETGPDEIIINGINGYLINPYNIEEMAEHINKLIEDRSLRLMMSKESYIDLDKFSENKVIAEWNSLIQCIC